MSHPLTTSHIHPGGVPQGFVLSCCCSLLPPHHTSGSPSASSPTSSRPCCQSQTCSAEKETRYPPLVSHGRRSRFSPPFRGKWYGNLDTYTKCPPTHLKRLSFLPHDIPIRRKPNSTPRDTQPPHFSILVPPLVSQSLIPRSPKNKPEHWLLGRALRARKMPL